MNNKNILIGAGVIVLGYLLWKKSQKNSQNALNETQYSKECLDGLKGALQQENVKPPNFEKTFLENCQKNENIKANEIKNKPVESGRNLGMPQVTSDPDFELLGQVAKLPNEFVVKSNGYNTRYYKDKNFSGVNYKHSFRTDGSIGSAPPIKISNSEFLKAYDVFLKQPK
jgi:hypothetical protein